MLDVMREFIDEFKSEIIDIKKNGFKKHIPNILTFSRSLAPLIIIPTILCNKIYLAIIELILFALTDFFDGRIARKYNCVSTFGIKLDAVCDKIFAMGLMIPTIIWYPILLANFLLELAISYTNVLSESKNNNPASIMFGKVKTTFLSISLILAYVPNISHYYIWGSAFITLIFQLITLIKYIKIDKKKDLKKKK